MPDQKMLESADLSNYTPIMAQKGSGIQRSVCGLGGRPARQANFCKATSSAAYGEMEGTWTSIPVFSGASLSSTGSSEPIVHMRAARYCCGNHTVTWLTEKREEPAKFVI